MKNLMVTATLFAALASPVLADKMEISPNGTRKTALGPQANFTGTVMVDSYFGADEDLQQTGALVTFLPCARSAWHTHPGGQILIATDGIGYYQEKGKPIQLLHKGDVVKIPPGVKHWHGASADSEFTHIAVNTNTQKGIVEWLEKVTDEEYNSFN